MEVAQRVGVDRRSVRCWKAAWRRGVENQATPRRPAKLDEGQRKQLEHWLLKGTQAAGSRMTRECQVRFCERLGVGLTPPAYLPL